MLISVQPPKRLVVGQFPVEVAALIRTFRRPAVVVSEPDTANRLFSRVVVPPTDHLCSAGIHRTDEAVRRSRTLPQNHR